MRRFTSSIVSDGAILTLNDVPITVVMVSSIWLFQLRSIVSSAPTLYLCLPDSGMPSSFQATFSVLRVANVNPAKLMILPIFPAFCRRSLSPIFDFALFVFLLWKISMVPVYIIYRITAVPSVGYKIQRIISALDVYFCVTSQTTSTRYQQH